MAFPDSEWAPHVKEQPTGMRLYYSADYVLAAHSFDTTRKAGWIAESLRADPIEGVALVEPEPLSEDQLLTVHDRDYVAAVRDGEPRSLAESNGFAWDPGLWAMVRASNGGAVRAALDALASGGIAGSLSSGLHHAKRHRGDGFCTFNGLALATRAALAAGASSVLIVDLDAHCGGGTFQILGEEPMVHQLDLAVSPYDRYAGNDRMRLDILSDATLYLPTLRRMLAELDDIPFDLVLYNAGMDPFEGCSVGGMSGITYDLLAERETTVFDWCRARGIPTAFVLAGGYSGNDLTQDGLVALHRLTITAAARQA
jgi:acetoin utilization deacetylase AcuC-like enzyme